MGSSETSSNEGQHIGDAFCAECYGLVSRRSAHACVAGTVAAAAATAAAAACCLQPLHPTSQPMAGPWQASQPIPACAAPLQGQSRLVQREVPGFRRILVRAFECEDCGRR